MQVFSWVRVAQSLVFCVEFIDHYLFFFSFYFGHCIICHSFIYTSGYPFRYLQTFLVYTVRPALKSTSIDNLKPIDLHKTTTNKYKGQFT
jgi:hypothetical protein